MKKQLILSGLLVLLAGTASATVFNYGESGLALAVPDGTPVGLVRTVNATDVGIISGVTVNLNISGGYNGDLYGYLVYQDGGTTTMEVLLNRVGQVGGAGYGSAGSGFANITLADGGTAIHPFNPGAGNAVASGTYAPDSGSTLAGTFGGVVTSGNGTWSLFLADLAAGDQSTLVSWGVNVDLTPVPEPITWALGIFGGVLVTGLVIRRRAALRKLAARVCAWVDAV